MENHKLFKRFCPQFVFTISYSNSINNNKPGSVVPKHIILDVTHFSLTGHYRHTYFSVYLIGHLGRDQELILYNMYS